MMNIGALSQGVMEIGPGAVNTPVGKDAGNGSFFQNVEKALNAMNKVSLKDEQDAVDLSAISSNVVTLIMGFYAQGGTKIELQDAQLMADKILSSDAMLDLMSYSEVSLNDIFLSKLSGGVLNGKETLADKIKNMDFTQIIDTIKNEISADVDLDTGFTELVTQVMDEIMVSVNQAGGKEEISRSATLFNVVSQIKTGKEDMNNTGVKDMAAGGEIQEVNTQAVIPGGENGRIYTGEKTEYQQEVNINVATKLKEQPRIEDDMRNDFGGLNSGKLNLVQISLEHPIEEAALTSKVLDSIQATMAKGNDSLFIKLKPDFLGGIAIRLTMQEGSVVARIVTSSEKTQQMLASQLSNLENTLKEKGIDVARMEVLYNPLNGEGQQESSRNQGRSQNEGSPSRYSVSSIEEDTHLEYLQLIGEDEELEGDVYKA